MGLFKKDPKKIYNKAFEVFRNGNNEKAYALFEKAAKLGDRNAMMRCGNMCRDGAGTAEDLAKSLEWYLMAAGQNDPTACQFCGEMYLRGEGTAKDVPKAVSYLKKAEALGDEDAAFTMGKFYYLGEGGVPKDYAEALSRLEKLIGTRNDGHEGQLIRAKIYDTGGLGVVPDKAKAFALYKMAAGSDYETDPEPFIRCAVMLATGEGCGEPDPREAARMYAKGVQIGEKYSHSDKIRKIVAGYSQDAVFQVFDCLLGSEAWEEAFYWLHWLKEQGYEGHGERITQAFAFEDLVRQGQNGDAHAEVSAVFLHRELCPGDTLEDLNHYLRDAMKKGNKEAILILQQGGNAPFSHGNFNLGQALACAERYKEALPFLMQALGEGDREALLYLAAAYQKGGEEFPQDKQQAQELFKRWRDSLTPGDSVSFGRFPQKREEWAYKDARLHSLDPVSWTVLDVQANRVLLFADRGLAYRDLPNFFVGAERVLAGRPTVLSREEYETYIMRGKLAAPGVNVSLYARMKEMEWHGFEVNQENGEYAARFYYEETDEGSKYLERQKKRFNALTIGYGGEYCELQDDYVGGRKEILKRSAVKDEIGYDIAIRPAAWISLG